MTFSIPKSCTLIPAYGRDYRSKSALLKDFQEGKNFMMEACGGRPVGKYCSIRDFSPGDTISFRYDRKMKQIIHKVK